MKFTETDVLVIGGGMAGCRAALRAKDFVEKVTLVDKAVVGRSGATLWGHVLMAPVPDELFMAWMREFVEYTEYFSDQEWVEILFREGKERIKELEGWGVPFVKNEKGLPVEEPCRGMREYCTAWLFQGRFWMEKVKEQLLKRGVELKERLMIADLLTSDGQHPTREKVIGAIGFETISGQIWVFKAKAVIIATGMMTPKLHAFYGDNMTGDGQAMAFRVGAGLADLEFALEPGFFLIRDSVSATSIGLTQFQNHGAYMINAKEERFMGKYLPQLMERGSGFGYLSQASVKEELEGRGPLYFDMRHWPEEKIRLMEKTMPDTMSALKEAGIDIRKDRVEFKVIMSLFGGEGSGGIKIGLEGETSIPGLFSAGASAKPRGCAEIFASATLLNCNVFGFRAGQKAGIEAKTMEKIEPSSEQINKLREDLLSPINRKEGISPTQLYDSINKKIIPWKYSVFKHKRRIEEALGETERIEKEDLPKLFAKDPHDLVKAQEAKNFLLMAQLYHKASLERKESRLKHYREEYPYRDDAEWLKWVILKKEGGELKVEYEVLPLERYPIKPEKLEKVPAPIQFSYPEE